MKSDTLKESIVSLLKPFAESCFRVVKAIPPQRALLFYLLVLAALAFWVISLEGEKPRPGREGGTGGSGPLHDLRLWAVLILAAQAAIYVLLR